MSLEATSYVWKYTTYTAAQSYVLLAIADVVNDTHGNRFFLGVPKLAKKTKCSERTVQRALKQFVEDGWLEEVIGGTGRGNVTEYQFYFLKGDNLPEQERVTPEVLKGDNGGMQRVTNEVSIPLLELNRTEVTQVDSLIPFEREDARFLANLLADKIVENGSKRPNVTKAWITDMDRLMRIDGRTRQQVESAIAWCQGDIFWMSNILSPATLREKYDQLRLKATQQNAKRQPKGLKAIMEVMAEEEGKKYAIQG